PAEPQPEPGAVRHVVLADQRVAQPSLQRSYLVPSIATAQPGEAEAIEVLVHALGSGSTSRLYRELIAEKGLAADTGAWYQAAALDMSRLGLYGTPRPGVTLQQLENAIDGVIAEVIDKGLTSEEIERAKNRMIAAYVYAQDSQASLARLYGSALTTGSSVEEVQSRPERRRTVTAEPVNAAGGRRRGGAPRAGSAARGGRLSGTGPQAKRRGQTLMALFGGYGVMRGVLFAVALLGFAAGPAGATSIERVISPGGIEAWLVRQPAVPLVAMDFAMTGGANEDPADKAGVAHLVASTVDEGAGGLGSNAYHRRPQEKP